MIYVDGGARARRVSRALGASALAIGAVLATSAAAQCTPDPTQANGTTTCTGTDPDGVKVTTGGTTVSVAAGAVVTATSTPAITVNVPVSGYTPNAETINVLGRVSGVGQNGIMVFNGPTNGTYYGNGTTLTLVVGAGASVTGTYALTTAQSSGNMSGQALIMLDNSGSLSGSSGTALLATAPSYGGFISVTNRATGTIGAIAGPLGTLTNAGTINGGTNSAVDNGTTYNAYVGSSGSWGNTGLITSTAASSTIRNLPRLAGFVNSGTISNTGSGAALQGDYLVLINQAGGRISSAGSVAIAATSQITLTNMGVITGNITANPAQGTGFFSTIDSSAGTVNGNVSLGGGNDVLVARYTGGPTLVTGITGTIDAGGGVNSVQLSPTTDLTVNTAITLSTTFQRLRLAPAKTATVTLAAGFVPPSAIEVVGAGTIVNQATIATTGQVFVTPYPAGFTGVLRNDGTIRSNTGSSYAYALDLRYGQGSFTNTGTVDVVGSALNLSSAPTFVNTGSVTATATGAVLSQTMFDNRGSIRSTGGVAMDLSGNFGLVSTNSGRLEGSTFAVRDSGATVINSGTITSNAVAFGSSGYATLINRAGGVVTGGAKAFGASDQTSFVYNSYVVNAGTINGDVDFTSPTGSLSGGGNVYEAYSGGVLNGNLKLGSGDTLVTDLVGTNPGPFAGIRGNVTGNGTLRYRVSSDASATVGATVPPFSNVGYELSNGAKLTLTAPSTVAQQLLVAGVGTVDVNANFSATTAPAILSTSVIAVPGVTTPATALSIISRGTITITRANGASPATGGAVSLGANDSFTNAGTINVVDRNSFSYTYAVTGGASVTNSGAIRLDGGYGVSGATTLTNTGTITQVTGGALAQGVVNVGTVINSGTINVGGAAVQLSSYGASSVLTNSGLVASTGGAAVTGAYAYNAAINNLAGGTIRGGAGTAVQMSGGTFTNAGTVTGTVDLGYASSGRSYNNATYVAAGGTVAGNLLFGNGDDLFLQTGATTGVSGMIDGGGGRNTYGRVFTASGSFALDAVPVRNFADRLIEALGADTVATATSGSAFTGNLYATGTGSVVNAATINGQLLVSVPYSAQAVIPAAQNALLSLTNTGSVSGVSGSVASFTNSGTIGAARLLAPAVSITNAGALSFVNSGQITANATTPGAIDSAVELGGVDNVSVTNSGAILGIGGVAVSATFAGAAAGSATVLNSGSVTGTAGLPALYASAVANAGGGGGTVTISNSGTVSGVGGASAFGTVVQLDGTAQPIGFSVVNTGTLSARGGTGRGANVIALQVGGTGGVTGQVINASGATVSATGGYARAALASGVALDFTNAGAITASGNAASIAVQTLGTFNNTVRNSGTITGDILLAGGADRVENAGAITGNVSLGAGDDVFVQRGGTVSGVVDGGDGADLLQVDASGGGAVAGSQFTNFERVQQVGTGNVTYSGAFGVGTIELASGGLTAAAGTQLSTTGATTITGTGAGVLITNAGTIAGGITLGDGGNNVNNSGAILGPVLLGAGNDSFRTTSGATLGGVVDGGAGYDTLTLALSSDTMLRPGVFQNFEALATEGASTLVLAGGAFSYDRVTAQGNLAIASDASLASNVTFGAGDNRFAIAGGFTGSVDGGAGIDTVEVSGGTQAAPVAFGAIGNVEAYRQTAGFATLSGMGSVGTMYLGGGRFVGLAGSVLTASQIGVDTGATFGSAGVVNGNITVAGTLSPGASPGTMTVNGNVALLGGSVSLFELTPAVSDKLVVNGSVGIAPGATLQLAPTGAVGGVLDLVTATGGVSGAFTSLVKPASLNGFLSYQPTRIQFVTAFTGDATFSPQAARALAYTNGVLASGQASAALLAGLPRLLTASGAASAAGFNRVTPEAYATAQQIGVESGLALADSARGSGFAAPRDRTGLFTFGELQGDWTRLPGNGATGASRAEASAQGLLGGVGVGTGAFSFGAFAGYRWTNQRVAALGARTRHDGTVAGVQARVAAGAFALVATGAYDGGDAVTTRAVPDGVARARYGLHGWTSDVSASYAVAMGANWRVLPHVGGTVIHDVRDRAAETGGSGFALGVARGRERASFVDGGVGLEGGTAAGARFHPFVSLGARYQLEGREPSALAGFGGGATTLLAYGARRAEVVGTGTLGFGADIGRGLTLFASGTGEAAAGEHRVAARAGLRARF